MRKSTLVLEGMEKPKLRRKNYIINRDLQFRFSVSAFVLILVSTLAVWYLMNFVLKTVMQAGPSYYGGGWSFLTNSNIVIILAILVDSIAVFLLSMYFSHSVAGPIYRMEKSMRKYLDSGEIEPIVLRKHDLLDETASLLNRVLAKCPPPASRSRKRKNS